MATANERLLDLIVRRQINLQRMSKTEGEALIRLLKESDEAVEWLIRQQGGTFSIRRLGAVQQEIARLREPAMASLGSKLQDLATGTGSQEMAHTTSILGRQVPVEINFAAPNPVAVRELILTTPFGDDTKMLTLGQWVSDLSVADQNRIMGSIQAGMVQGLTVPKLTQNVQQALGVTHRQAEALARTSVNHAANTARNATFAENSDVIKALMWSAQLDGRTSPVCRARDGSFRPPDGVNSWAGVPEPHLEDFLSPPAHIRCRSTLVPILDDMGVAEQLMGHRRATVTDTRTGRQRQIDFERQARDRYGSGWRSAPRNIKTRYRQQVRQEWARENVGQVPGHTSYGEWLRRQDRDFVVQVMGPSRAKLFLDGGLKMDQFVDRFGQPLTLEELARLT